MAHLLIMGLFETPDRAARAARTLRDLLQAPERVSLVARSHDEEVELAKATGGSPGSEIEDSRTAGRLGELGAHFLSALALVMPGIGPIVADGPLAAELGEAAGHLGGGLSRTLQQRGMPAEDADRIEAAVERGSVLVGAHVPTTGRRAALELVRGAGPVSVHEITWPDPPDLPE